MSSPPLYADVALGVPSATPFQYSIPEGLREKIALGQRVYALVRTRRMVGYVVGLGSEKIFDEVRPIDALIDEEPVVGAPLLELTRWMAEYYQCGWGQCLETAMPAPFKKGKFRMKSRGVKTPEAHDPALVAEHVLSKDQEHAFQRMLPALEERRHASFLLHGITGSGKTEVYMHLIREAMRLGRGSIVLVPEISLTPQTVERFSSRFGECVAVIHSRLTQARRVEEWHRIRSGAAKVVVGARSAIFSPVKDLGVIVIDEEHDTSYKQDETPRYETRRVAAKRGDLENAVVVLGSATPSLESFHAAETGASERIALSERIEKRPLPIVEIVDMREEAQQRTQRIFSAQLEAAVKETLAKGEQVMLLLNRRGFSTYLHCSSCGYVMTCENCRTTLAYHYDKASLFCHMCSTRSSPQRLCPGCQKSYLHYFGIGTQKVESEAQRLFPVARVGRMDTDSTSRKDAHEIILKAFKKKEINILIGTQMIAKGHDFPNVSLIGVISADTALHIADFRAAERTFDLLTQVAGRAGRGDVPGKVLIQTHVPNHYSIQTAQKHDYEKFYSREILYRRELDLPPFKHLLKIILSGAQEKEVMRQSLELAKLFAARSDHERFKVLGPAPSAVSKHNGQYYWNLYIKGPSVEETAPILRETLKNFKRTRVALTIDVDPQ